MWVQGEKRLEKGGEKEQQGRQKEIVKKREVKKVNKTD